MLHFRDNLSQGEKWDTNKKQKKPEMEHYMPKKVQENRQSEIKDTVGERKDGDKGKVDNLENSEKVGKQDGGGGGTGRHKRKGKGGGNKGTLERNKAQNQGNRGGNQDQGRKGGKQEENKNRPNQNQDQVKDVHKGEKSGKISPSNSTGNKNKGHESKGNDGGKKGGNKGNNSEYDKKEKSNKDGGEKNNQRDMHQNTLDRKKKLNNQQGEKCVKNQVQNDDIPTRTLDRDNTKDRRDLRREHHDGFNQDIPRERYDNRQDFGRGRGERGFDKPRPLSGIGQFRVPEPPQHHGGYHRGNQGMRNYNGHAEEWHGYGRNQGYGNDGRNRGESEPKHLNHNGWMGNKDMDG